VRRLFVRAGGRKGVRRRSYCDPRSNGGESRKRSDNDPHPSGRERKRPRPEDCSSIYLNPEEQRLQVPLGLIGRSLPGAGEGLSE
jgi:hypothetical protein